MTLCSSQFGESKHPQTQLVLTVDDIFLRNEWVSNVPVLSSKEIRPEEDLRVLEVFEDLHVDATVFVSGIIAELFPEMLHDLAKKGFEIAAHGYRHENFLLLEESERMERLRKAVDLLEKHINGKVVGWRSPGLHADPSLYRLLGKTNVLWCSDIELPLRLKHTPFMYYEKVEIPIASVDLNLYRNGFSPERVKRKWLSCLDQRGGLLTLVIHPWVQLCKEERLRKLKGFLELAQSKEDVTICTGFDVYKQFMSDRRSVYGSALSVVSSLWKRFSNWTQSPLSKALEVFSSHA